MNVSFFGLAILAAIVVFLLRAFGWKGTPVFICIVFIGLLTYAFPYLEQISSLIKEKAALSAVQGAGSSILKVVGIGYITGITSDICRELDSFSLSSVVSLVGRIEIIAGVLPFFNDIMSLGGELLG